jgi:hypothetical protein
VRIIVADTLAASGHGLRRSISQVCVNGELQASP